MIETTGAGMPAMPAEPNVIPSPEEVTRTAIQRNAPDPSAARAELVKEVTAWCVQTYKARKSRFDIMKRDMKFVRPGGQWGTPNEQPASGIINAAFSGMEKYEANITQRYIQQRTAALYAKNPKAVARRRRRLDFKLWDGNRQELAMAVQAATMAGQPDPMIGMVSMGPSPEQQELLMDVQQGMERRKMLDRIARTLEVLYQYYQDEGTPTFKIQAKQLIRRVITTGVGFVQLGFQRLMAPVPEIQNRIRDDADRLRHLESLAADIADEIASDVSKEMDELRLGMQALEGQSQIVLREGLVYEFPDSTDIIVDMECKQLKGFIGANRIARQFKYTKQQIQELFGVDIGDKFVAHDPISSAAPEGVQQKQLARVFCCWDKKAGLVYFVCEGYPDFLKEPEAPDVDVEQYFPLFALTFNDLEDEDDIYPPSDVSLGRPMQMEMNRAREGLREHRIANKPGYIAAQGMLNDEDKQSLADHAPNGLIELSIAPDAVKEIEKYLARRPAVPIDPAVYETEYVFADFQRVTGDQEANLGGTSGSTATEASIAESSRVSGLQSNIDDLNDFLTAIARAAGQIMLAQLSKEQVEKIAGPGAVWPEMSREEIAEEIYLEIQAGSSGRPNKAMELANMERLAPFILQLKGLDQEWLARQFLTRLDENIDLEDAFDPMQLSVVAQNAATGNPQPGTGDPATDPGAQGAEGGNNALGVPNSQPGPKPDIPPPMNMEM